MSKDSDPSGILVVTDRRILRLRKGKSRLPPILLEDVAATRVFARDLGRTTYMLVVETHESVMYTESDSRKFHPKHYISIDFDDPQPTQALSALIDEYTTRVTGRAMR